MEELVSQLSVIVERGNCGSGCLFFKISEVFNKSSSRPGEDGESFCRF